MIKLPMFWGAKSKRERKKMTKENLLRDDKPKLTDPGAYSAAVTYGTSST